MPVYLRSPYSLHAMSQSQFANIANQETDLWDATDNLSANSKLTAGEYCMPVLGVIFFRHATNRYHEALREIQADQAAGKMPKRPLSAADFKKRRALLLPKAARYDELVSLPKGADLGTALVEAMNAIERDFEPLQNQLPKDYTKFENNLLEDLLRVFDSETLRSARGDVFGRINEYFLMKFAMQGAQNNGEFFTPPSIVQTIVNVIEPDHGIVFDPACGSGGTAKIELKDNELKAARTHSNRYYLYRFYVERPDVYLVTALRDPLGAVEATSIAVHIDLERARSTERYRFGAED